MARAQSNTPTLASPPAFIASDIYTNIRTGFNSASLPIINNFISLLNTAVHYASAGKQNFQVFRNESFNFDVSGAPSVDQKNLMILSKMVFSSLLNSGNTYARPLTGEQIEDIVNRILSSGAYQNLSQVNPTSQLATKVGNLKTSIATVLNQLKATNPSH